MVSLTAFSIRVLLNTESTSRTKLKSAQGIHWLCRGVHRLLSNPHLSNAFRTAVASLIQKVATKIHLYAVCVKFRDYFVCVYRFWDIVQTF